MGHVRIGSCVEYVIGSQRLSPVHSIVTIRNTLMIAFLLASLLPSLLLATLAFRFTSASMHDEIESSLQVEAATVSQDIDKMLFERLQNAQTWSRLEVMQAIHIKDVDKQLSKFLNDVKSGYRDVYSEVFCTDPEGRIVASSDPASIGRVVAESGSMPFAAPGFAPIRMESLRLGKDESDVILPIDVDIASLFKSQKIGKLTLLFNWSQMYRILDQAGQAGRLVIVVDRDGRIIAASSELRSQRLLGKTVPSDWFGSSARGTATRDGTPLGLNALTIGFDRSRGFQEFHGFGWTTLVIQPSSQAFVPVRNMAFVFVLLLALTSSLAAGLSIVIAGRIARPITSLTGFTRDFMQNRQLPAVPRSTGSEVGELTDAFVQTIQELEQSRVDLIRASTLAALGELSAVMAHEIRTPIGILRSSAQMLAREPHLSDEGRELTTFIQSETERLNGLVSTLLDSTRTREPSMKPVDINELVHFSIALLSAQAEKNDIAITERRESRAAIVNCDAEQITQVLLNLIQNALQILPRGGHVDVYCEAINERTIIEIADDGPGIEASALSRVFEPFFTKRDGGIGLGLAVVRQIIAAHDGTILAGKSAMGGALFTISLPAIVGTP
jgi:signal transduction histidine kinase